MANKKGNKLSLRTTKDMLLKLWQFQLDTTHDDPTIHPSKFCKASYVAIRVCILDSAKTVGIKFATFKPHNEDVMSCAICKHHIGHTVRKGRPRQAKRGRKKDDPVGVAEVAGVVHAYAKIVDDEPCHKIQLAKQSL